VNVLKAHFRITIATLLASGTSQRDIEKRTGVDRKTIRRYAQASNSPGVATGCSTHDVQIPPPRPPALDEAPVPDPIAGAPTTSACEPLRAWIEAQVVRGRNAVSVYQDLVEAHGFLHHYNSVKRFVARLKRRVPERFDVLEFPPGEEAQVDFGQGAPTCKADGKYKRPWLFVRTLKYSGKSFRKVVWKATQEVWAQLHEEAFRAFGGCPQYVVLDNLKAGVIRPDLYELALNPVYAALLAHYGVVADACRIQNPNRKGTVESAIQHTQGTALKGRTFETSVASASNDAAAKPTHTATAIVNCSARSDADGARRHHNSSTRRIPSPIAAIVRARSRPLYSPRKLLSIVIICETFATESVASPASPFAMRTFPGASARDKFDVRATATTVRIRLALNASVCTITIGRRYPGSEAIGSGSVVHHTVPRRMRVGVGGSRRFTICRAPTTEPATRRDPSQARRALRPRRSH